MKTAFHILSDVHVSVNYELTCPCVTNRDLGDQSARAVAEVMQHTESHECPLRCAGTCKRIQLVSALQNSSTKCYWGLPHPCYQQGLG